jgi:hypothetical protein
MKKQRYQMIEYFEQSFLLLMLSIFVIQYLSYIPKLDVYSLYID